MNKEREFYLLKCKDPGIDGKIWRRLFEERHLKNAFSESHKEVMWRNADILYFELTKEEYEELKRKVNEHGRKQS